MTPTAANVTSGYDLFSNVQPPMANDGLPTLMTTRPVGHVPRIPCQELLNKAMTLDQMKSVSLLLPIYSDRDPTLKALPNDFFAMVEAFIASGGDVNMLRNYNDQICLTFFTNMIDWFCNTLKMLKQTKSELDKLKSSAAMNTSQKEKEVAEKNDAVKMLENNVAILRRVVMRIMEVPSVVYNPSGFQMIDGQVSDFWPLSYVLECDDQTLYTELRKRRAQLPGEGIDTFLWERICTNQALAIGQHVINAEDTFAKDYRQRTYLHYAIDARAPQLIIALHKKMLSSFTGKIGHNPPILTPDLITMISDFAFDFFTPKDEHGEMPFDSFLTGYTPDKERETQCLDYVLTHGGTGACERALEIKGVEILTDERYTNVLEALQRHKIISVKEEVVEEPVHPTLNLYHTAAGILGITPSVRSTVVQKTLTPRINSIQPTISRISPSAGTFAPFLSNRIMGEAPHPTACTPSTTSMTPRAPTMMSSSSSSGLHSSLTPMPTNAFSRVPPPAPRRAAIPTYPTPHPTLLPSPQPPPTLSAYITPFLPPLSPTFASNAAASKHFPPLSAPMPPPTLTVPAASSSSAQPMPTHAGPFPSPLSSSMAPLSAPMPPPTLITPMPPPPPIAAPMNPAQPAAALPTRGIKRKRGKEKDNSLPKS